MDSYKTFNSALTYPVGLSIRCVRAGGGGRIGGTTPPPPLDLIFLGGWAVRGVNPPPPPPPPLDPKTFFFVACLLVREVVMYEGYPYTVSGKLTPTFQEEKSV